MVVMVAVAFSVLLLSGIVKEAIFQKEHPMENMVVQGDTTGVAVQMHGECSCDSLRYYKHKTDSLKAWRRKFLSIFTKKTVRKYTRDTLDYAPLKDPNN